MQHRCGWLLLLLVVGAMLAGCAHRPIAFTIGPAAKSPYRVTEGERDEFSPAISPDGRWLAFVEDSYNEDLGEYSLDLWVCDPVTGSNRQLVRGTRHDEGAPGWFPGSDWLLLHSDDTAELRLYKVRRDGLGGNTLVGQGFTGKVSPDSTEIVYVKTREFPEEYEVPGYAPLLATIWVMKVNGTQDQQLTSGAMPAWSPDGERIAFGKFANGQWDIWSINRDGSEETRLTFSEDADEMHPCWSPSGREIAFCGNGTDDGNWDIFKMGSRGGELQQVTMTDEDDYHPSWATGGMLYFASEHFGSADIWRVEVLPGH